MSSTLLNPFRDPYNYRSKSNYEVNSSFVRQNNGSTLGSALGNSSDTTSTNIYGTTFPDTTLSTTSGTTFPGTSLDTTSSTTSVNTLGTPLDTTFPGTSLYTTSISTSPGSILDTTSDTTSYYTSDYTSNPTIDTTSDTSSINPEYSPSAYSYGTTPSNPDYRFSSPSELYPYVPSTYSYRYTPIIPEDSPSYSYPQFGEYFNSSAYPSNPTNFSYLESNSNTNNTEKSSNENKNYLPYKYIPDSDSTLLFLNIFKDLENMYKTNPESYKNFIKKSKNINNKDEAFTIEYFNKTILQLIKFGYKPLDYFSYKKMALMTENLLEYLDEYNKEIGANARKLYKKAINTTKKNLNKKRFAKNIFDLWAHYFIPFIGFERLRGIYDETFPEAIV
jgi:hypothetical protein